MKDRIPTPERRVLPSQHLPGKTDARFQGCFIELNTHTPIRVDAGNELVAIRLRGAGTIKIEICLAVLRFRDRWNEGPGKA